MSISRPSALSMRNRYSSECSRKSPRGSREASGWNDPRQPRGLGLSDTTITYDGINAADEFFLDEAFAALDVKLCELRRRVDIPVHMERRNRPENGSRAVGNRQTRRVCRGIPGEHRCRRGQERGAGVALLRQGQDPVSLQVFGKPQSGGNPIRTFRLRIEKFGKHVGTVAIPRCAAGADGTFHNCSAKTRRRLFR